MKLFEILCTADAQITERWYVEAEDEETARAMIEGEPSRHGLKMQFIENVSSDFEENREVVSVEEIVQRVAPYPDIG